MLKLHFPILLILLFFANAVGGQTDTTAESPGFSETINTSRLRTVAITGSAGYMASMSGLYFAWYDKQEQSSFHFFNDNKQWLQMDKAGHVFTAYNLGKYVAGMLKWSKVPDKNSAFYGGGAGLLYLTTIEVFDGFSTGWGASTGDIIANAAGTGTFLLQEGLWKEQRIKMKFSFHPTSYAQYRPEILGGNFQSQILKDYNGQSYWLSANLASFFDEDTWLPKWLNIAAGYSGEGMTGGSFNPKQNGKGEHIPQFNRYRQYFFSLDVDLEQIKTRSAFLNTLLAAVNFVKIPFPALEYNEVEGFVFRPFYF